MKKTVNLLSPCARILLAIYAFAVASTNLSAQSLAINTTGASAHASSVLDVNSTNKGMLIPRVALTGTIDVTTILSPATSLLIYNTATVSNVVPGYYYWGGSSWTKVVTGTAWSLAGNSGTAAATDFIGTTDNVPLSFRINNQKSGLIDVSGNVFLGYQAGNVNATIANTGIGFNALNLTTNGSDNTATGYLAMASNTNGTGNTATGSWVLSFNTVGSFNSAYGINSMAHVSTGANNSAFGAYALDGGSFMTGNDNTAGGYQAMKNNLGGNKNAALGRDALYNNTSGNENTGIGYEALYSNGPGNFNTATGAKTLRNNYNGEYNTASGYMALYTSSGSNNTAVGYGTLAASNTGSYNTAVGSEAMPFNTSGSYNTAAGNFALLENTTGSYNTALGYKALQQNHAGSSNVAIGNNALTGVFNDNNTAVGTNTGLNATNGTNCTFIGYQAGINSGSLTNATAIGYNASVTASNSLVLGEVGTNVGIGVINPSYLLHVKGFGETQVTIENQFNTTGLLFRGNGNDVARIQHNGGYLEIEDYSPGWNTTALVINQGDVGIGVTNPTAKLSVNGTANNATGVWGVFSDERIKTITGEFTDGLNVIKKIRPVKFNYNENAPYKTGNEQVGIVAQELEKIAPYMVNKKTYDTFSDLREVNNQAYVFLLINAVKEQQARIEVLEKTVQSLSMKIK
ncbi:MAG: tail fiber domain-containing protein [Ferruginibacter sp.]